jgi:hypothetical protein
MKPILAIAGLLVIAAPVVQAGFDWFDPSTWNDAFEAPDPQPYAADADLSAVLGKIQVTRITGITALSVVDFDDVAIMLKPDAGQLTVRQVPKVGTDRPTQTTALAETSSLTLVQSAFYSYYAGAQPNPPEAATDPSYAFHSLANRVSVANVVPMTDLTPNAIVGPALMTTETLNVAQSTSGLRDNPAALSLLDVDGQLEVVDAAPTYDAGASITSATTQAGMKAMLDEIGVVGATLTGVLTSLSGSNAPEVGAVNSDGVAATLSSRGYTLRKIVSPVDDPGAYYVPTAKQVDLVNPAGFQGELVFVPTPELKDVGEDRIIGLKGATSTAPTQVLVLFDSMNANVADCACYALLRFDPALAGITDAYNDLLLAPKRMDRSAVLVEVDPGVKNEYAFESLPGGDVDKYFIADTPGKIDVDVLGDVLKRERVEPPIDTDLPDLFGDSIVYLFDVDQDRLDRDIPNQKMNLPLQDFTTWIPGHPGPKEMTLPDYLGQLQSLDPRQFVPMPEPMPSGLEPVGMDAADGLVFLAEEEAAKDHADRIWSSLQVRTTTREARAPVSGAHVRLEVYTPAHHGGTIQEFEGETNNMGYASFTVMPASLYNVTATKEGFLEAVALGATGGPGEETGKDVQMTPRGGWEGFIDGIAEGPALALGGVAALAALIIFSRTRRGKRLFARMRGRGRGGPWRRFRGR